MTNRTSGSEGTGAVLTGPQLAVLIGLAALPGFILADHSLMTAVRAWRWPALVELMEPITWLGYGALDVGMLLLLALVGWWGANANLRTCGLWGAGTVAIAGILDQLVKNVICRARPSAPGAGAFFAQFPCFPASYAYASFPSGHATTAFAAAVVLALWYPRRAIVFMGLAVLVGLSRVMLEAHFPSDVVGGALLGSGVALAIHSYVPAARRAETVDDATPK